MNDEVRANRYRRLFARLDRGRIHQLVDRLQILALTSPDTLREFEAFLDRDAPRDRETGTSAALTVSAADAAARRG